MKQNINNNTRENSKWSLDHKISITNIISMLLIIATLFTGYSNILIKQAKLEVNYKYLNQKLTELDQELEKEINQINAKLDNIMDKINEKNK